MSSPKPLPPQVMSLQCAIEKVKTFQTLAGQVVGVKGVPAETANLVSFRQKCLLEEIEEYRVAKAENNRVEELDALVDITYFVAGFFASFPERFSERPGVETLEFHQLKNSLETMVIDSTENCLGEMAEICLQLFSRVCREVMNEDFYTFNTAFQRVHENNMTKFLTSADVAAEELAKNQSLRVTESEYEGKKYYILVNEFGKVQKPSFFKPVVLDDLA